MAGPDPLALALREKLGEGVAAELSSEQVQDAVDNGPPIPMSWIQKMQRLVLQMRTRAWQFQNSSP